MSVKFLFVVVKKTIESDWDETYIAPMAIVVVTTVIFTALLFLCAIPNVIDIITCLTFPEKMIFDYVSTLMKSV